MQELVVSRTPWGRLPVDVATALRSGLEASARTIAQSVTSSVPVFAEIEDPKFRRDLYDAVRVALDRFLDLVGTDEPALQPRIRETFVALGAAEAREHRGPEDLLAALRIASRVLLRTASQALSELRPVAPGELLDLSDAVTAYVDELAGASTDGFALQLREQAGEGDRRRRQLGELLLRGNAAEGAVMSAAAGIGWRSVDAVVPVLLPAEQARDARFRYGADGVVIERERDAVLLLRAGPRSGRSQLAEALRGRGAVVGPSLGWARVPEAVRLAELTAQLLGEPVASSNDPNFTDDHLATLALRGEPGALAVLTARRLAPFAHLREAPRQRLLETLYSWLRHWGSRTEVAAELFVHPQTVSYRLKRLRELLGDDIDDATVRFELLLALADHAAPPRGDRVTAR